VVVTRDPTSGRLPDHLAVAIPRGEVRRGRAGYQGRRSGGGSSASELGNPSRTGVGIGQGTRCGLSHPGPYRPLLYINQPAQGELPTAGEAGARNPRPRPPTGVTHRASGASRGPEERGVTRMIQMEVGRNSVPKVVRTPVPLTPESPLPWQDDRAHGSYAGHPITPACVRFEKEQSLICQRSEPSRTGLR
jgi:hypothetical protein